MTTKIKPPFPYFGGKSKSAKKIWEYLGDPQIFIEPFMGSAACTLARPEGHKNTKTIINDSNSYICNFYRALQADPAGVMKHCNWPRFEQDMHARHRWLVLSDESKELQAKIRKDPDFYDVKLAGWWVYGINMWIGDKWCVAVKKKHEIGPGRENNSPTNMQKGIHCKEYEETHGPNLKPSGNAKGVHRQEYEEIESSGGKPCETAKGIHRQEYDVLNQAPAKDTQGVHRQEYEDVESSGGKPCVRDRGIHNSTLLAYLQSVAAKIRYARILNGDWTRVFTESEISTQSVGVFLDPPYDGHADFYGPERASINDEVRNWCIEYSKRPNFKIIISGYETDNDILLDHGFTKILIGKECGMNKMKTRQEYIWVSK